MSSTNSKKTAAAVVAALIVAMLIGSCSSAAPTADSEVALSDAVATDAAADFDAGQDATAFGAMEAEDERALRLLLIARAGSAASSAAQWPSNPLAVWPGFALHQAPTMLVMLSAKGMPSRAYLFGVAPPPAGAQAVTLAGVAESIWRYDAGKADLGPGETVIPEHTVDGRALFVATWSPYRDTDDLAWIEVLARGYMVRLREIEAAWSGVQACGQTIYPRFVEAIALVQLECATLSDALAATDADDVSARLHEWAAARAAGIAVSNFVGLRTRHYDNLFGSERFVAGRLSVAAGQRSAAQWTTTLRDWLALPTTAPVEQFDTLLMEAGEISAAAMEAASRVGWDVEPSFSSGNNAYQVVVDKLGVPPASALAAAKGRHDWAGLLKRAEAVMALPKGDAP